MIEKEGRPLTDAQIAERLRDARHRHRPPNGGQVPDAARHPAVVASLGASVPRQVLPGHIAALSVSRLTQAG